MMKRFLLPMVFFLLALAAGAQTPVQFPITAMVGQSGYSGTMTLTPTATLLFGPGGFQIGTPARVNIYGTNPVVYLQPNTYKVGFSGTAATFYIVVPASTNTLNATNLLTLQPIYALANGVVTTNGATAAGQVPVLSPGSTGGIAWQAQSGGGGSTNGQTATQVTNIATVVANQAVANNFATATNNGSQTTNQFTLYEEQYYGNGQQLAPIVSSTWPRFGGAPAPGNGGGTLNSNALLQTIGLWQPGVSDMGNYSMQWLRSYAGGFYLEADEILTVRSNNILCINTDPANSGTNLPWTLPQLANICHTNGIKLIVYFEPNNTNRNGLTSNGNPDSEGTNIEWDAQQAALAGLDGARIDPHGWTTLDQFITVEQRFESAFRQYATNRQVIFVSNAGFVPQGNGQVQQSDNYAKAAGGLPGTLFWVTPDGADNLVDTNTSYATWLTNMVDACAPLSLINHPGQWYCPYQFMLGFYNSPGNYPSLAMQFQTFAAFGCPMLLANFDGISAAMAQVMTNKEFLDIEYDPAVYPLQIVPYVGQPAGVGSSNTFQVYNRPLSDGSKMVWMLSRSTNTQQTAWFTWTNLGVSPTAQFLIRDAWNRTNFGVYSVGFTNTLPPETCNLLRLYPVDSPAYVYLQSQIGNATGITNNNATPVSLNGGLSVQTNLSSEIGHPAFGSGLYVDVMADVTNTGTVTSRSPLAQTFTYGSFVVSWTNSAYGPGFFGFSDANYSCLNAPGMSGANSNAMTWDFIGMVSNSTSTWAFQTNGLQIDGLVMNNNGYVYLYLNGSSASCYYQVPAHQTGQRFELTGTYDSSTSNCWLYYNGVQVANNVFSSTVTITNVATNFMTFASANGTILRGRMWNRALNSNEISALYIASGGNQYVGSFTGNGAGLTNIPTATVANYAAGNGVIVTNGAGTAQINNLTSVNGNNSVSAQSRLLYGTNGFAVSIDYGNNTLNDTNGVKVVFFATNAVGINGSLTVTGAIASATGFSGPGTGLTGTAAGLTAGTATVAATATNAFTLNGTSNYVQTIIAGSGTTVSFTTNAGQVTATITATGGGGSYSASLPQTNNWAATLTNLVTMNATTNVVTNAVATSQGTYPFMDVYTNGNVYLPGATTNGGTLTLNGVLDMFANPYIYFNVNSSLSYVAGQIYITVGGGNVAAFNANNVDLYKNLLMQSGTVILPAAFPTNQASWYLPTISTTGTVTNSVNNGKTWDKITISSVMAAGGINQVQVQMPGIDTNFYTFFGGVSGTTTNTIVVPIQPGYTNTVVDAATGSASDTVINQKIIQ